jgi:hypothetical protein
MIFVCCPWQPFLKTATLWGTGAIKSIIIIFYLIFSAQMDFTNLNPAC